MTAPLPNPFATDRKAIEELLRELEQDLADERRRERKATKRDERDGKVVDLRNSKEGLRS